jgi:hypothetical protein
MNIEQFYKLRPGQIVYDNEYNVYGEVKEGAWKNIGILSTIVGSGLYIVWDDGDRSEVGLTHHTAEDISKFELSNISPT